MWTQTSSGPSATCRRLPGALALLAICALGVSACRIGTGGDATPVAPDAGPATGSACFAPPAIPFVPEADEAAGDWQTLPAPETAATCFRMTAELADSSGVAPDSGFVLQTRDALKPDEVAALLDVSPPLELEVTEAPSPGAQGPAKRGLAFAAPASADEALPYTYRLSPTEPLEAGSLYRFALLAAPGGPAVQTFSFQAQRPLTVVQTLPQNQVSGVPLDTGIELTFSHDGVTGLAERASFDPPLAGTWEQHKRTFAFLPDAPLAEDTLYTLTVAPGVGIEGTSASLAEPFRLQFETGSDSRGEGEMPTVLGFARDLWESGTAEAPVLAMYSMSSSGPLEPGPLPFTVYRYTGPEPFAAALGEATAIPTWASQAQRSYVADTTGLTELASFEAQPRPVGDMGDLVVSLPEPLAAGYYLVATNFEGQPVQTWLQVTDLAAYVAVSVPSTLLWVNDVDSQTPVSGAQARDLGGVGFAATTGADGSALVDTPAGLVNRDTAGFPYMPYGRQQVTGTLLVSDPAGRTAIVPLVNVQANNSGSPLRSFWASPGDDYWRYLYLDRHLYRPTDTVRFWGVIRPRYQPGGALPLTVELVDFGTLDYYFQPAVAGRAQVTTRPDGTFIGELDLVGTAPGYYNLQVKHGETIVASSYAEVRNFVKPAYRVDVVPEQSSVFVGEPLRFEVRTSFFEGSPLPGVELNYNVWTGEPLTGTVTTDVNGETAVVLEQAPVSPADVAYQPFEILTLGVNPTSPEEAEIGGSGNVRVFRAALDVAATGQSAEGQASVSGTVYGVDPLLTADIYSGDPATWRTEPAGGQAVTAEIVESTWERVEQGQSYDYVSKTVVPRYYYEERTRVLETRQLETDRAGEFALGFAVEPDKSYAVRLTVRDAAGRAYTTQASVTGTSRFYAPDQFATLDGPQNNRFAVGDEVAVTMQRGGEVLPTAAGNRYLFMQAQNGIRQVEVQDGPAYAFTFEEEDVPSVQVVGVRFTGGTYQEASWGYSAQFESAPMALGLSVSAARESYQPGDEASVEVTVTDAEGRPAQAEVLLSAVDEAIYRLQGLDFYGDLGILSSLYAPVPGGILQTYAAHQITLFSGGAEGGGGGGGRSDFKDTVLFQQVSTGADGKARVSFPLPDNLTSWRVAALGVTEDLRAGSGTGAVVVRLPAFVDLTLGESYLTSDQPVMRLRAYGEALEAGDAVNFEVSSPTLLPEPLSAAGQAFESVLVPLPALSEGRHVLTVALDSPGGQDALERTVDVVPSRLAAVEASYSELATGQTWTPVSSPPGTVQVYLTDANRGRYHPILQSLAWAGGDRMDQVLARSKAQELLGRYFQTEAGPAGSVELAAYLNEDGGLGLLPYGSSDLVASAHAADLAPDRVPRQQLARYFRDLAGSAEETRERSIIASFGLAAVGEPVLPQIQALAATPDLSWREGLYLGLAAAALGDEDTARQRYAAAMTTAERRGPTVRLNVGQDQDDVLEATSLAAVLAARLADQWAPLLFQYVIDNAATDTLLSLFEASFLSAALPTLPGEAVTLSYNLAGERETVTLAAGEGRRLQLSPTALAELDLKAEAGRAGVGASYLAARNAASIQSDPDLKLSRSYEGYGDPAQVAAADLVRVRLDYDLGPKAVDGCYVITDLLPSGLFPVTRPWAMGYRDPEISWPFRVDGQRISFCVRKDAEVEPISYLARVVTAGDYNAEPALMQSEAAPESLTLTTPLAVEIR